MISASAEFAVHVDEVQAIGAVPKILETVAALTGLGFVAVAHVTASSWTTCAVRDTLGFGLKVGDGLEVTTTLCDEVRSDGKTIVIDHVRDSAEYCDHHTPRTYGFQSYFSVPIFRLDGSYFGTLCGLDPKPALLSMPSTVSTLELFAQLISTQLESERAHAVARTDLLSERETAELREQFIAVLGHDVRTPLHAIQSGLDLLKLKHPDPGALPLLQRMKRSVDRIATLVDDVVDFTRGRMGGGIPLVLRQEHDLQPALLQVVDELRGLHPEQIIVAHIPERIGVYCDAGRLGQLLSNLLKNALVHGRPGTPVHVSVKACGGVFSIAVQNAGETMPSQLIDQLFKPFWRAPSESKHEGLGLGLYIVSEIARSHDGAMNVASKDGINTFTLSMPQLGAASPLPRPAG